MKQIKLTAEQKKKLKTILSNYPSYRKFSNDRKVAYQYAKIFSIRVCPYCNFNYINTVMTDEACITRPEFDHFVSKGKTQLGKSMALDYENLIPSCHECNSSVKSQKQFRLETHVHPFKDDFDAVATFAIDIHGVDFLNEDNFSITIEHVSMDQAMRGKVDNSVKDLKLLPRYQQHKGCVVDIFKLISCYSSYRRKEIDDIVNAEGRALRYLDEVISSNLLCEINRTSLGKLKKDIIKKYYD